MENNLLYVKNVPGKGRGVFAAAPIQRGQVFESAVVVDMPRSAWEHLNATILKEYCFSWGKDLEDASIVLGFGMIYNHSYRPNARFDRDLDSKIMNFIALRNINEGEEITIHYYQSCPETKLGFNVVD